MRSWAFAGCGPGFFERIGAGVRELAPRARLTQVTAPPVVGAALLGLDRFGAPPGAAERLRATLTAERLSALRPVGASTRRVSRGVADDRADRTRRNLA